MNEEQITISKFEYNLLKEKEEEQYYDFVLKIYRGAVSYNNKNKTKIEIFGDHFAISESNIQIDGTSYNLNNQQMFNDIVFAINQKLNTLINWSIKQTKINLDKNSYEGGVNRLITVKYGNLTIFVNGQTRDIGNDCDEFINEIINIIEKYKNN